MNTERSYSITVEVYKAEHGEPVAPRIMQEPVSCIPGQEKMAFDTWMQTMVDALQAQADNDGAVARLIVVAKCTFNTGLVAIRAIKPKLSQFELFR